jgi:hypothetical protein
MSGMIAMPSWSGVPNNLGEEIQKVDSWQKAIQHTFIPFGRPITDHLPLNFSIRAGRASDIFTEE